jgi:hypothetical protein
MNEAEWNKQKDARFPLKTGLHSEEDISKFLAQESLLRDSFDHTHFKMILIPDYKEDQSAIVYKMHHIFGDGFTIATFLC